MSDTLLKDLKNLSQINNDASDKKNIFPVDVFTKDIQKFITTTNETMKFPLDYLGTAIIAAAGLAIGNKQKLYVKSTWHEAPIIFAALVGRPGQYKTHSLKIAFEPIKNRDKVFSSIYDNDIKDYQKAMQVFKSLGDKAQGDEPVKPYKKKRMIKGHTIEAFIEVVKENGIVGVVADELKEWFGNLNRYTKGSDIEFWLSAFSGEDIDTVRKTTGFTFVDSPYISVVGGIQNSILPEMGKEGRNKNGFTDRVIFALPDSIPQDCWIDEDLPPGLTKRYSDILNVLLEMPGNIDEYGNNKPDLLYFSDGAKKIWAAWYNNNAAMKHEAQDDTISGIYTKLEVYTLRFALILQMLQYASNEGGNKQISEDNINGAIKLTEYYRATSFKVSAIINGDELERESEVFKKLYELLPETFARGEAAALADELKFNTRTLARKFKNKELFKKVSTGKYQKVA